jgi:hypothetical protein
MDQLQTRLEALEQQMDTITRRLRWWRGLAGGLLVLAVLTWALPSGMAKEDPPDGGEQGLTQRVAALSGSATTNESGEATFTYVGTAIQDDGSPAGDDTITAWVDLNGDGEPDPTEPHGLATKSWVLDN